MKRWLPLLCLLVFTACQKDIREDSDNSLPAQTYLDAPYGSDALQKMDIYLPAGRTTAGTRIIILVHGGAWSTGDKSDFAAYADTLKTRLPGYAIFSINYRLATATANLFPTQENDVKAAFDFIVSKADDYKVSKKIALLGASAGAHLALLQGYKYTNPVKAKAIVDFFGPTDLAALHNNPNPLFVQALETLLGGTPATNPVLYEQSSPISFVTADSPPTLILQGGLDPLVPVAQSTSLEAKLQAEGVVHQYLFYPTEGHGWTGPNMSHSFDHIQAFLTANMN